MLGSPSGISVAHVGRRLDLRREFKRAVAESNEPDDSASYDSWPVSIKDDATKCRFDEAEVTLIFRGEKAETASTREI